MAGSSDGGGRALASGVSRTPSLTPLNFILLFVALVTANLYTPLAGWAERLHLAPAFNEGLGVDRTLPLVPQLAPVYLSLYAIILVTVIAYVARHDGSGLTVFLLGMTVFACVSDLFFWLAPTAFTIRPPSSGAGLFGELTRWTWGTVGAYGAFPSGHNGLAALCAVAFFVMGSRWKWVVLVWAAAICVSTWLLKEHYVLDTVGSVPLAIGCFYLARWGWESAAGRSPGAATGAPATKGRSA